MKQINELKQMVSEDIHSRREQILDLCSELIKFPSENPPGDMNDISGFLQAYLEKLDCQVDRHEFKPAKLALSLGSAMTTVDALS